jgi:hypothetical protein
MSLDSSPSVPSVAPDPQTALRRNLLAAGYRPVPLVTNDKIPVGKEWQHTANAGAAALHRRPG